MIYVPFNGGRNESIIDSIPEKIRPRSYEDGMLALRALSSGARKTAEAIKQDLESSCVTIARAFVTIRQDRAEHSQLDDAIRKSGRVAVCVLDELCACAVALRDKLPFHTLLAEYGLTK